MKLCATILSLFVLAAASVPAWSQTAESPGSDASQSSGPDPQENDFYENGRLIHADIAALDQIIVYNRFGSFDPYGMVFALRRDISEAASELGGGKTAAQCAMMTGTDPGTGTLSAGKVRLKDCKRPRPLVLRGRAGDVLRLNITNLLRSQQPGISETFCQTAKGTGKLPNIGDIRAHVSQHVGGFLPKVKNDGPALCAGDRASTGVDHSGVEMPGKDSDFPRTRLLSFVIPGIEPIPGPGETTVPASCKGLSAIKPNETMTCHYRLDREGSHLFQSVAAPVGGEGDGGSLTHGLFGALLVEPPASEFYRSQLPMAAFDTVWSRGVAAAHARVGTPDYAKAIDADRAPAMPDEGNPDPERKGIAAANPCDAVKPVPVAAMLRDCGIEIGIPMYKENGISMYKTVRKMRAMELVHSDINAVIVPAAGTPSTDEGYAEKQQAEPFREFVVIFHDELKTFYTKRFQELGTFGQFSGVRDGFGINYGASGAGSLVLANKLKIGPSANCPECMYEEFFLESWANGDPALLENFANDPSNVHHSYLNDRVVFRNFHAGPKETHVFHLHSHQWFAGNDKNRGAYLDSQTIGPQQGMSYDIYGGGAELYRPGKDGKKGWFETLGSGNRNRTPGDAIFHCHLYPHFAQGMWELWRVHDVLEDGTRTLPDGQQVAGLSLDTLPAGNTPRTGTLAEGAGPKLWAATLDSEKVELTDAEKENYLTEGTPIPGLLPVPGQAAPLLPTYDTDKGFPGYPFYIAGTPGHRTPQAPMDIAMDGGKRLDGGLGRHVVISGSRISDIAAGDPSKWAAAGIENRAGVPYHEGKIVPVTVAQRLALGDLTETFHELRIKLLPPDGTALERRAMAFHHSGLIEGVAANKLMLRRADGTEIPDVPGQSQASFPLVRPKPAAGAPQSEIDQYAAEVQAYETAFTANYEKASGYASTLVPRAAGEPAADARFVVNGSAPRPGAPFADPCGAPEKLRDLQLNNPHGDMVEFRPDTIRPDKLIGLLVGGKDQFGTTTGFAPAYPAQTMTYDPALSGFRRFAASVVQFDMVVNKAGWHDPQARINVVSENAHLYKPGGPRAVSGKEEPFYFRAFSGECIEFRHTNESPHKLGLDDFQTKVPTDTIGQHIHLVKFDVTSSDGSGNGFNYEDGTFAPDELKERIHAAEGRIDAGALSPADQTLATQNQEDWKAQCDTAAINDAETPLWTLDRRSHPACFQTTVQRWFADPILTPTGGDGVDKSKVSDRTLRTVFTHDHFAPSNIQQHGFYNALLIEPARKTAKVYLSDRTKDIDLESQVAKSVKAARWSGVPGGPREAVLVDTDKSHLGVGARARVFTEIDLVSDKEGSIYDPLHPNYREFALAIADFALIYDGKRGDTVAQKVDGLDGEGEAAGLDRLIGEAGLNYAALVSAANKGKPLAEQFSNICQYNRGKLDKGKIVNGAGTVLPPAQAVACEIVENRRAAKTWLQGASEQMSAVFKTIRMAHGKPVYPPERPEAISQGHHDPYLVNYRNEPMPLRVGETANGGDLLAGRKCPDDANWSPSDALDNADSIRRQKVKTGGDMATVFRSREHGDPCTPLLEAYEGERVMVRLIQGAQEVQHVFTVEGKSFRRNVDQPFSYNSRLGADDMKHNGPTRWNACMKMAESGSPSEHSKLFGTDQLDDLKPGFLDDYRKMTSYCDNATGMISGQEIGISEHFEVAAKFSATSNVGSESFRQKVAGAKMMAAPAEGGKLIGGIEAALPVRDSLYHFGTVDALWNGSWGMLRIFANKDSTDVTKCLAADGRTFPTSSLEDCIGTKESLVGMRLIPVPNEDEAGAEVRAAMTLSAEKKVPSGSLSKAEVDRSLTGDFPDGPDLSCPFIEAKAFEDILDPAAIADMANAATHKAPNLVRALVAIEARKLGISAKDNPFGGVPYDAARGLHDPDGLMLVPVPLASLGLSEQKVHAMTRRGADSEGSFAAIDWRKARDAAKAVVEARGYIPYVQRIRAGDCLRLVIVNGLTETIVAGAPVGDMTGNARRGLRDRPGDALLPKITKLNTDLTVDKDNERQDYTMGELTASASLALTIPMSMMTHADDVAEPVGINPRPALAPAVESGQAQASVMTYFAGTIGFEGVGLDGVLSNRETSQNPAAKVFGLQCKDPALRTQLSVWPEVNEVCGSGDDDFTVPVLGRRYCVKFADPATRKDRLSRIEDCFRQTLQTFHYGRKLEPGEPPIGNAESAGDPIRLRIVPHAFGALPVKSLADPIGHAAHGLAGMMIVEPMEAQFECAAGDEKCANAGAETALTAIIKTPEIVYSAGASQIIAKAQITEHAMLWQDGLNLWDGLRKPMYSINSGGCVLSPSNPNCSGPSKKIGGPVPDCDICDDSYDHGEKAANYGSNALFARLRGKTVASDDLPLVGEPSVELPQCLGLAEYESPAGQPIYSTGSRRLCAPLKDRKDVSLNAWPMPRHLFADGDMPVNANTMFTVKPGAEIAIRIVEGQGRARQRAFVATGMAYQDLFPGFGSGHSTLIAPGKTATAAMRAPATEGSYLWMDGPRQMIDGGAWGLMKVRK